MFLRLKNKCKQMCFWRFLLHIFEQVGCRPPWDSWSPASIAKCDTTEQMDRHEKLDWALYNYEKKIVINSTGCKIPCKYNEYKLAGEPQSGSSAILGTDNDRQRLIKRIPACNHGYNSHI